MKVRIAAVLALLLIVVAVLVGPGWLARYRARDFSPIMRDYVAAGLAGDSAALERVSIRENPVHWALSVRRTDPDLFQLAARGLTPELLSRTDTGQVRFLFHFAKPFETHGCRFTFDGIYAAFHRTPAGWRLVQAGIGPC